MKKFINLVILFIFYGLFFQILLLSFSERIIWPSILPTALTFRAWHESLTDPRLITGVGNSFVLSSLTVILTILFSWPYAATVYGLSKRKKNIGHFLEILAYLPIAIPILIPAFGLYETLATHHYTGNIFVLALILAIFLFPYMYRSISNEINQSGDTFEEQARSLGSSEWMTFFKITIPRMSRPICVGGIFVFSGAFNDYLLTYLIGDGELETLPLVVYPLMMADDFTLSSVYTIIFIIPFLFLSLLLRKSDTQ